MREASSLVLAARLLAEGARVRGYDPVAAEVARERLAGIEITPSARGRASRAPTPPCWSPSGPRSWSSTGRAAAPTMRPRGAHRRAQRARRRRRWRPRATSTRGSAGPSPGERAPVQAVILVGGEGRAPAPAHRHPAQADDDAGRPAVRGPPARPPAPRRRDRRRSSPAATGRRRSRPTSATARRSACGCATWSTPSRWARPARSRTPRT